MLTTKSRVIFLGGGAKHASNPVGLVVYGFNSQPAPNAYQF